MALKILWAGGSRSEREQAEAVVRTVLRPLPAAEAWRVSLVKLGEQWSLTLDGPDPRVKAVRFLAPPERLQDSIAEALLRAGLRPPVEAPPASAPEPTPAEPRRDRHECQRCGRPFVVVYEARPEEPVREAPVACPHCWLINRAPISQDAASSQDYRSEKLAG